LEKCKYEFSILNDQIIQLRRELEGKNEECLNLKENMLKLESEINSNLENVQKDE